MAKQPSRARCIPRLTRASLRAAQARRHERVSETCRRIRKHILQANGWTEVEGEGPARLRVHDEVSGLVDDIQRFVLTDQGLRALQNVPHVHVHDHDPKQLAIRGVDRSRRPQRRLVRDADVAVLSIQVDPGQIEAPGGQARHLPIVVAIALALQGLGGHGAQAVRRAIDPYQLTPAIADADQAQLEVFRLGIAKGEKDLLQPLLPLPKRGTAFSIRAATLQCPANALDGRSLGQKQHVLLKPADESAARRLRRSRPGGATAPGDAAATPRHDRGRTAIPPRGRRR